MWAVWGGGTGTYRVLVGKGRWEDTSRWEHNVKMDFNKSVVRTCNELIWPRTGIAAVNSVMNLRFYKNRDFLTSPWTISFWSKIMLRLVSWFVALLVYLLVGWFVRSFVNWVIVSLIDWWVDWLVRSLIELLVLWLIDGLIGWFVRSLIDLLVLWSTDWLIHWLVDCLID